MQLQKTHTNRRKTRQTNMLQEAQMSSGECQEVFPSIHICVAALALSQGVKSLKK